jgi:peptidoglycan biosynthesis protein MviN/MurJ (putative lipid II flippase)
MATLSVPHSPRWYGVPVRSLLLTFIGTLLTFSVSLLVGIVGTLIASAIRGVHPDMQIAYRHFALPAALIAGCIILIASVLSEIQRYRQARRLNAIERLS